MFKHIVLVFAGLVFSTAAHANPIINASFEDDGHLTGASSLTGWDVVSGNVDTRGALHGGSAATDGTFLLDLAGFRGAIIRQTVAGLSVGEHYAFSFDLGANTTNTTLYLALSGAFDFSPSISARRGALVTHTFNFQALTSALTIQFRDRGSDAAGPALDNVVLAQTSGVPEAPSIALIGLGFLSVAVRRRRRVF